MRMSPASRWGTRSAMVLPTTAAGTINQTARGFSSFFVSSAREEAPTAFSSTSSFTAFGDLSKTTQLWPCFRRRRTMFAPIRPSPIMPSCIATLLSTKVHQSCWLLCRAFHLPVTPDQVVGGAVVLKLGRFWAFELWDNRLRQRFAQLNAPLVERVDVPDDTLGEDAMLVQRDELAQRLGCEPFGKNRVRWPVALEHAVWHQPVWRAFRLHLLGRFAKRQRLGLSEDVGQQHVVVPAQWREGVSKRDEITRNQ